MKNGLFQKTENGHLHRVAETLSRRMTWKEQAEC